MIPFDFHNHSTLSPDADDSPEEMVKRAIALGMTHYALTDHLEINKYDDPEFDYGAALEKGAELIPQLQRKYADSIKLLYAVEFGQALHNQPLSDEILAKYKYDFIIGSCHMVRDYDDFYYLDYNELDPIFLLNRYFDEVLEMAQTGDFDVLGHLTYPLRYITGKFGIQIDMSRYSKVITKIFEALTKNGKGIEINTSGLRDSMNEVLPGYKYVKEYYDLGGRILTIGSDAHCTEDLGKGINDGIKIAKDIGFKEIACFVGRKPEFIAI